jgi:hypothetical protein
MTCRDDQTGDIYYREQGYAGTGQGRNNPDAQGQTSVGPLPRGEWQMTGDWYYSTNTGQNTMVVSPLDGNECIDTDRECDTFRLHGNNIEDDASEGCIVLPLNRTDIRLNEIIEVIR